MSSRTSVAAMIAAAAIAAAAATSPLQAQSRVLAGIDSLVASSRFRDASAALDRWERENAATVSGAERATAMLLRARMVQNADSARDMYLSLSLSYPSSPEAAVALLRLGQLAFAADDRARAASYFQRIISDHPRASVHPDAVAWLARTRNGATGSSAPGSSAPGSSAPGNSALGNSAPGNAGAANPVVTARTPPADASATAPADGAFTLQVGAFRAANTAQTVVRQLAKAGFTGRAVTVPANALVRVRVGRYATSRAADDTMRRLRAAGFEAVVVNDARTESAIAQ